MQTSCKQLHTGLQKPFTAIRPRATRQQRCRQEVPACTAAQQPQQQSSGSAQHSRRQALAMGAAAGVVLPGLARSGAASAAVPPQQASAASTLPLCRAASADCAAAVPVADVAEGSTAARQQDRVEVGKTGLEVSPIGIGAWSWGDKTGYWGYEKDYQKDDNFGAYNGLVESGVDLIDTAEVYGYGQSEQFIGEFMRQTGTQPKIATKFAPLPWRFTSESVVDACRASIGRLGVDQLALYQIHWPAFGTNWFRNDAFLQGLADCQVQGLTKAVGVSNFKEERVRQAVRILQDNGVPLASNQVQYSLLYRAPETNGVLAATREAGATLIAYSPLCQGLLTGKYKPGNVPAGARGFFVNEDRVEAVQPLIGLMRDIGSAHGGKTPGQVAINWCICKGTLPIPGAKKARQAREAAGGFGWRMSDDEVAALDAESAKLPSATGAPFEKW